jgi:hypothetical protein
MDSGMNFSSHEYLDLFLSGLKVVDGMSLQDRKKLHHNDINYGCIAINLTKVLNGYLQLLYA